MKVNKRIVRRNKKEKEEIKNEINVKLETEKNNEGNSRRKLINRNTSRRRRNQFMRKQS